jgi:L-alanine-DL-glutamate epimerase-like enolase superfamily enzyme
MMTFAFQTRRTLGLQVQRAATNYRRSPRTLEPFPTLLEYDMSENALRTELAQEPIRHSGGIVAVPQGPGLGIEIDREVLQKYC